MKNTVRSCHICGGASFGVATSHYERCMSCGHETLSIPDDRIQIINDRLDRDSLEQRDSLDRFKAAVVRRCALSSSFLLDIGSASGRFLYQHRHNFDHVMGVEVTPECIRFSRGVGLHIEPDLDSLEEDLSVVTFWHSLEHIPTSAQVRILDTIRAHATDETVVVVSVPNSDSVQYRLLRTRFAFYDVPAHLHQFSTDSLDALMAGHSFEYASSFVSLPYAGFGWLQGLLNMFNSHHNYLYYRTKRGWDFGLSPARRFVQDAYNVLLIGVLFVPATILTVIDILFPQFGGVVTRCYHAKTRSM